MVDLWMRACQGMAETFGSTCHGAGRAQSRNRSRNNLSYEDVLASLASTPTQIPTAAPEPPPGPGSPRSHLCREWGQITQHLHREWPLLCNICGVAGLDGSLLGAQHICTRTRLAPATSAPGLR